MPQKVRVHVTRGPGSVGAEGQLSNLWEHGSLNLGRPGFESWALSLTSYVT